MFDLNDLRFFLAVARAGSLSAAARKLGVAQPTVGRRIQNLEKELDARLFRRSKNGYQLTDAGKEVLPSAELVEENAWRIENKVMGAEKDLHGTVRLATSEGLANCWILERLDKFQVEHPNIKIEVFGSSMMVDLLRRQADIALRIGSVGSDELVGQCLGKVSFGIYASNRYISRNGEPTSCKDMKNHHFIESVGEIENFAQARVLRELISSANISLSTNNLATQTQATVNGIGIAALPSYVAARQPDLKRVLSGEFDVQLDMWLLTHKDLRFTRRIRAVIDYLKKKILEDKELLVRGK